MNEHYNIEIRGVCYTIEKLPVRKSYSLLRHEGTDISVVAWFKSEEQALEFREVYRTLESLVSQFSPVRREE